MSEDGDRWLARGQIGKLSTTFICDGPDHALNDLRYLEGRGYQDVAARGPDGRQYSISQLEEMILGRQVPVGA